MNDDLHARLAAAKLWLTATPTTHMSGVGNAPYLAAAVYAFFTVRSSDVDTISLDAHGRLYVNREWAAVTEVSQIAAEIAHSTVHLLLDHAGRANSMHVGVRERSAWTQAADTAVGEFLADLGIAGAHIAACTGPAAAPELTTEERYALLSGLPATELDEQGTPERGEPADQGIDDCGSACDGLTRGYELAPDADAGRIDRTQVDEIRKAVAIAYNAHQDKHQHGSTPGEWARFVAMTLDPVLPWQQILAASVRRAVAWAAGRTEFTYTRPSRRQAINKTVVMPGQHRPVPAVGVVCDTSGSIDDVLLAAAMAEVRGILDALGGADSSIRVFATDAAAHTNQLVRRGTPVQLIGGGGTDMGKGLAEAAAARPTLDVVVVCTDGYTDWPPQNPTTAAVIIALLGRQPKGWPATPSWATRVECLIGSAGA